MYIERNTGKGPVAFSKIDASRVFENEGKIYLKAIYNDQEIAVSLWDGKVVVPQKGEFMACYVYPAASVLLSGQNHRQEKA